jgi:hypothetical protein
MSEQTQNVKEQVSKEPVRKSGQPVKMPGEDLPFIDDNTVILSPAEMEAEAALAWLSVRYPEIFPETPQADEILRVELDTIELTKRTQVYVLARKRVNPRVPLKDALAWEQTPDGQRATIHTSAEELAKECKLYGPINCAAFFQSSGEKWQAPRLSQSDFLTALSEIARPWAVSSPYVTEYKAGQQTTRFRLRNC